jgi:hypothetical protein
MGGMTLFKESISNITFNIECIEFFKSLKRKYKYCAIEEIIDESLRLLKEEQKKLAQYHNSYYSDDVDIKHIENAVKGVGMKMVDAVKLITQIRRFKVSDSDEKLLSSIARMTANHLSVKQSEWLNNIYTRVVL